MTDKPTNKLIPTTEEPLDYKTAPEPSEINRDTEPSRAANHNGNFCNKSIWYCFFSSTDCHVPTPVCCFMNCCCDCGNLNCNC